MNVNRAEQQILEFWTKDKTYEKVKRRTSRGKKFYFMDGPPYASGNIHMGTALNKILKDIALRSQRMQGKNAFDRPGYDTHGVPIEYQVEKEINSKSKQDIERYGVKKFVERCKKFATQYINVMNVEFQNLGVWMDWQNPYLTLTESYIETIWAAFKAADKKGLLYKGSYPVHICPRCETAVAYNEIVYGKQKDLSVFVKFPLKNKKNTYLLIWTTTPWTLPGNTGVMVNPGVIYQEIELSKGECWIIAKDLVAPLMSQFGIGFRVREEFSGRKMENWQYENPLYRYIKLRVKNAYRIVLSSRYVTTDEGTGLVHTAPGHGREDYEVGKENNLDAPCPVTADGILTREAGKYAGKKAREVDAEIIEDLERDGFLVSTVPYDHDYPLCWRDNSPLLMVSIPQWFLKISRIQKKLLRENEKVAWIPKFMQLRMKAWLEGVGDWPLSRQRYWGTPLPIWVNEKTGERIVIGSIAELQKLSGAKKIDVHKPGIDEVVIKKLGKTYTRVPEVLDVWFDSGVSSWAALDYARNKGCFKKYWPADLNIEGKDQFRGWWNSQLILSEIMFGKKPFENIVVHGMVLDVEKSKMSKSKGNVITPGGIIEKFGRDYLRYYFAKFSKGEDFSFDEKEFHEIDKFITILMNVNNYINQLKKKESALKIEDAWILSRYNSLLREVADLYNSFKYPEVLQKLESFVFDLSRDYIQIIRERADETHAVLSEIRNGLLQLFAPIIPFVTEKIWLSLSQKRESIHLSRWPEFNLQKINKKLEENFVVVRRIIEAGLAARDKEKIGLRWPLPRATISIDNEMEKTISRFTEILKLQLNVKDVALRITHAGKQPKVDLDTTMTRELEAEGYARELARKIQAERKNAGLRKEELIDIKLYISENLRSKLKSWQEFIRTRTHVKEITYADKKLRTVFTIRDEQIGIEL